MSAPRLDAARAGSALYRVTERTPDGRIVTRLVPTPAPRAVTDSVASDDAGPAPLPDRHRPGRCTRCAARTSRKRVKRCRLCYRASRLRPPPTPPQCDCGRFMGPGSRRCEACARLAQGERLRAYWLQKGQQPAPEAA